MSEGFKHEIELYQLRDENAFLREQLVNVRHALMQIEKLSDYCVNAEHYTAEDALNHLSGIRNVIKKAALIDEQRIPHGESPLSREVVPPVSRGRQTLTSTQQEKP